jgi:hypothetical protein
MNIQQYINSIKQGMPVYHHDRWWTIVDVRESEIVLIAKDNGDEIIISKPVVV